jgi:hypothetical protein
MCDYGATGSNVGQELQQQANSTQATRGLVQQLLDHEAASKQRGERDAAKTRLLNQQLEQTLAGKLVRIVTAEPHHFVRDGIMDVDFGQRSRSTTHVGRITQTGRSQLQITLERTSSSTPAQTYFVAYKHILGLELAA